MSAASSEPRRNRWAISFADLALLLLGFFVLLQASGGRRDAMVAAVGRQFGASRPQPDIALPAATLFEPGEALLRVEGRRRLTAIAARMAPGAGAIELRSDGSDPARQRFDRWDLAAARLGAVARVLREGGIADRRLMLRGLDQADMAEGKGQTIHIVVTSR